MDNLILSNEENGVLTITLNRLSKKNALTSDMYLALCTLFERARTSDDIRCLVIQGDANCFCAGNDLADFLNAKPDEEMAAFKFIQTLANFNKPIVAAVAGAAVGIGTTLLLHSDIVIAAENSKFALPFTQLGLCPEAASSMLIPNLVGHVKAFELLVLGESFDANTALSLNLVNKVVNAESLLICASEYATKIAALPNDSVMTSRALLKQANSTLVKEAMALEGDAFARLMQTPDCKAILSKFLKK
ncbi:crotonase [Thalassotalea sp. M1531]|uniref:Crotonase n=1 Tax=Thalassotalea algicola TaxID=2716224 RepID=A0A7Y0L9Q6_9GAMM|nr:enoyl-CoA hydratase-related protein [Thalassotalea algicola]NMP30367.1 crotonase [Thalassotalea algicola]